MWKRLLCTAILAHASFGVWAASGGADSYPSRPIRIIDGFPAGGGTDYMARVIGPKLTERFGQTVIVDNRPGAATTIATDITARANPDGHTLLVGVSISLASTPSLYPKLGYDVLKDFAYISRISTGTIVLLANPSIPAKSISELVAFARSKPKAIRYGSSGVASTLHLGMELLQRRTGTEFLHVPYKGAPLVVIALTGGEIDIGFASLAAAIPMIESKRLTALGVASEKRLAALPQVPTVAESGVPGFDVTNTYGILAPAATPAAVVKLLNAELRNIVQMDDVKAKFTSQGLDATGSTPEEFRAIIKEELTRWARVIKEANIPPN